MNARTDLVKVAIPSLAMSEPELISVLQNSVYPGAKPESIKLVIAYCRGAQLDPLQKPVHIVPMDVKTGRKDSDGKDIYEKRDVIMHGVGHYRIQAARSGEYAGMSEPEFGPDIKMNLGKSDSKKDYVVPEWCKVTVCRSINGAVVDFTAIEYWVENYATAGNWTTEPNKMWKKRPRGQLAKCAEAQALRKAFPELGAAPTADEMEGKTIDVEGMVVHEPAAQLPPLLTNDNPAQADISQESAAGVDDEPANAANALLSKGERAHLKGKLQAAGLTDIDLKAKFGIGLEGIKASGFKAVKAWIANPKG